MKRFTQYIEEAMTAEGYAVMRIGGSIGEKTIRSVRDLKGETVDPKEKTYTDKQTAKDTVKRMNKLLSPGEKKYYGIRYITAEIQAGKFTGKG